MLQKRTNDLVAEILDDKKSFTKQASYKLDRVYRKVCLKPFSPYSFIYAVLARGRISSLARL